ncbi:Polyketide synthase [Penicillium soppii]|jgi:hypothetical protein|uniref:Polyketide synthase n=1 Tax=Penicillium soppii TaxID=69789 RepID=UPI002548501B|nr:Polyketide synthase [Penicillium soppii]KAJ5864580.1 Polyketide synthase [Penicillium soppii]
MYQEAPQNILIFGPQALAFNQESFWKLQASIANSMQLGWVNHVVAELPDRFNDLSNGISRLKVVPGASLLKALSQQIGTGDLASITEATHLPNIVLTPLCVISHLVSYTEYLELRHNESGWDAWKKTKDTDVVGFCTGILTALVVSLSDDLESFKKHGATAIRLAMMIGAVVDAEDVMNGSSVSLSAAWRTREGLTNLEKIIRESHGVSDPGD